MSIELTSIP